MGHVLVGVMWAKNEADIIRETIEDVLQHVDTLMIADDGSIDGTWRAIRDMQAKFPAQIEHIQQHPNPQDKGQRESLLNQVKRRYRPLDAWVQVVESDCFVLDTDIRARCQKETQLGISWQVLNAVRPAGTWPEVDTFPRWTKPIREIMPLAHRMEVMLNTFRPLPELHYDQKNWRPWPRGWSAYVSTPVKVDRMEPESPLLLHVGHRGPTHFYQKYRNMGAHHSRYASWDLTSPERIAETVAFFNGDWNNRSAFPANRAGWKEWIKPWM